MKKITFLRIGGLSSVNYKKKSKYHSPNNFEFHPPKKRGVYAFIFPYSDTFLWAWKCRNQTGTVDRKLVHVLGYRKFEYEGWLWCHFLNAVDNLDEREVIDGWVKVHTSELAKLLRKVNHEDCKSLIQTNCSDPSCNMTGVKFPKDAYKRGRGGFMSVDHLEVFIEKV